MAISFFDDYALNVASPHKFFQPSENKRMMRHNHVYAQSNSLINHSLGDINTQQDTGCLGITIAHLKATIVVALLQMQWRICLDGRYYVAYLFHLYFLKRVIGY